MKDYFVWIHLNSSYRYSRIYCIVQHSAQYLKGSVQRKLRPRLRTSFESSSLNLCPRTIFIFFYWRYRPQFMFKKPSVSLQRTSSFEECWFPDQRHALSFEVFMFGSKMGGVFLYIISSKVKVCQFLTRCGEPFPLKRLCMYVRRFSVRYLGWRCFVIHFHFKGRCAVLPISSK